MKKTIYLLIYIYIKEAYLFNVIVSLTLSTYNQGNKWIFLERFGTERLTEITLFKALISIINYGTIK